MTMIDPKLLEILVCPRCKGELRYREKESSLDCTACGIAYEVRDGIPILLISEGKPLT